MTVKELINQLEIYPIEAEVAIDINTLRFELGDLSTYNWLRIDEVTYKTGIDFEPGTVLIA